MLPNYVQTSPILTHKGIVFEFSKHVRIYKINMVILIYNIIKIIKNKIQIALFFFNSSIYYLIQGGRTAFYFNFIKS